ncbi:helix-turn-helix domain-containing protein, partial [Pseudonocardia asaccharolytica]|uniref:helix-turn-helix domain-containing protein n=1 Tax=Pseudonocardia asaccharolytica TaxID=54010 RepID=UPI001C99EA7B
MHNSVRTLLCTHRRVLTGSFLCARRPPAGAGGKRRVLPSRLCQWVVGRCAREVLAVPHPAQEQGLLAHCGHARFVWNLAVEQLG